MSTNMTTFNPNQMPADISRFVGNTGLVSDLTSGAEAGFPVLSIKGRVFRVKYGGEERVLQHQGQPIFALDVVLVKANPNLSKLYYAKAYAEGDDAPPACSSANGIIPDAGVSLPQSPTCALCQHNVWGSKITPQGTKTKACADTRRVALIPERDLECKTWGAPLLLRIPAASLQPLSEYARTILGGKPYSAVVTRISFDLDVAYPKLTFMPIRWLNPTELPLVIHWAKEAIVSRIIGVDADPSAPNMQHSIKPLSDIPQVELSAQAPIISVPSVPALPAQVAAQTPDWISNAKAPPAMINPYAGVPDGYRALVEQTVIGVGGPETDLGKSIIKSFISPVGVPSAPTATETPKRTRKAAPRTLTTPLSVSSDQPQVPKQDPMPAIELGTLPSMNIPQPTPTAQGGGLLQGVDELLEGLENLNFDE